MSSSTPEALAELADMLEIALDAYCVDNDWQKLRPSEMADIVLRVLREQGVLTPPADEYEQLRTLLRRALPRLERGDRTMAAYSSIGDSLTSEIREALYVRRPVEGSEDTQ